MSTRARAKRGPQTLKSAAGTISYEYRTFLTASRLCLQTPHQNPVHGIALESALVHARILRDFFTSKGRGWLKRNDILVIDFLPKRPPFKLTLLRREATKKRMDTLIAHASYRRPLYRLDWRELRDIQREIVGAWKLFLDELEAQSEKRRSWFGA